MIPVELEQARCRGGHGPPMSSLRHRLLTLIARISNPIHLGCGPGEAGGHRHPTPAVDRTRSGKISTKIYFGQLTHHNQIFLALLRNYRSIFNEARVFPFFYLYIIFSPVFLIPRSPAERNNAPE